MKLTIVDFTENINGKIKIKKKYLCSSHGGDNICPEIRWTKVDGANSYLITMIDPDTPSGETFVHLILYINGCCQFIDKRKNNSKNKNTNKNRYTNKNTNKNNNTNKYTNTLTYKFGKNSLNEESYHGPCAPPKSGVHRYIFTIKAYKENIDKNISKYTLLDEDTKIFTYSHPNS